MAEIRSFRTQTLQLFLAMLEGRSSWATLISVLRILIGQAAAGLSLPSPGTLLIPYQCWGTRNYFGARVAVFRIFGSGSTATEPQIEFFINVHGIFSQLNYS